VGTIRAHEFTSMDGVVDEPRWTFQYPFDPRMGQALADLMGGCRAILLGRRTYEMFAPAWSTRTASEDPGAPFMNDTPKYVVSATMAKPTWQNTELLGPYRPEGIRRLKERVDGGIYVSGSATLVHALIADDLLDELNLFVFPTTRGSGPRLFAEGEPRAWALRRHEAYANGALYLVYGREPAATQGT